ncbi:conserved hypothetical protein [Opitutus terrae PB90-1]|uniref:Gylcosyl hydrolase 115 C-terminal domain-containing protein n=2 Tax=Opitutus terrae TaxID=107709 RepID=B1ZRX5_OPITP|nr:conserved hypothetical protein [Opitutus terrae PB90-1]
MSHAMIRASLPIRLALVLSALACIEQLSAQTALLTPSPRADDFILANQQGAAVFVLEPGTDPAVARAVDDLRADIERVSNVVPALRHELSPAARPALVLVAVAGKSSLLDRLAAEKKLDLRALVGAWESFVIAVVHTPFPGVERALVIAGSDRRGAIYGCYEVSAAIGVSPWHWWADVPVPKRSTLAIATGTHRFGPPSVKYRGVFLNDEDWGLQPWAAKTFEPETGDIGPKTYAKLFELLLRLKANTVWPAMHPTTRAFNHYPRNKEVADAYGIVMGSSHAEPMLRNNVDEWTAPKEDYNYVTNREGVLRYWEERVAENGRYEAIYTLGMRGIHDSNMVGPKTDAERIRTLERVFADQRALIARHVRPEVGRVIPNAPSPDAATDDGRRIRDNPPYLTRSDGTPQMFCAYKEVLDLYRQGLRVPDDVTIVWPDDNFGYIRNFATAAERGRSGGFGIYYHLSYLGRPLSYLWLSTTPPALVWEEMHKAYQHGADRIWIANVGDLKPAEIGTEFFLQMAWDIDRWSADNLATFLPEWTAREFGPQHASEIASILDEYYRLNFQRRPEHLQWWLPKQPRRASPLTDGEVQARLEAFARLRARVETLRTHMRPDQRDAFFQLVYYPVAGSALANQRFFEGERGNKDAARAADAGLVELTRVYNEQIAGGKWRGMMTLEPADKQWASMRIEAWTPPDSARAPVPDPPPGTFIAIEAGSFASHPSPTGVTWMRVPRLGRTREAVTVLPATVADIDLAAAEASAPRLEHAVNFPAAGEFTLQAYLLPTHPISGTALRFAVALDDAPPQLVTLEIGDGGPEWAQGVLNATRVARLRLAVPQAGEHALKIYGIQTGVVLDKVVIDLGGLTPSYLGP